MSSDLRLEHQTYVIRRKVLKLFGGAFHVFDADRNLVFFSKMKAFTLREDIRLFGGEDEKEELLRIGSRTIVDFSAAYDVVDVRTGQKLGALRRRGLKSLVRDAWVVLDAADNQIGSISEDSGGRALLRRVIGDFSSLILPQRYSAEIGGAKVMTGHQNRNPFVYTVTLDFSADTDRRLDRRLGIAAGLLLAAIEGKQG